MNTVKELTKLFVDRYTQDLGFDDAESGEIGYIGYSNAKHKIKCDEDLRKAYESGKFHKSKNPVFYVCRRKEIKRPLENYEGRLMKSIRYLFLKL